MRIDNLFSPLRERVRVRYFRQELDNEQGCNIGMSAREQV